MALTVFIDGAPLNVSPGQNLLEACLAARLEIPYFCWHPALGSVGACRQCAVKIFRGPGDEAGQIVMACMTPVEAGLRVSIADAQAAAFRESVVELVLTNHPHDCPVCEVGGECHLQDMAALTGHAERRATAPKRTHLNQNLGPFIKHEMNRCIGCYRCVRFYRDHAGGNDFGVFGTARNIYFGRAADGVLESQFAGNLVEVCPTGVFVDKPFSASFRRKWDMRSTPSVCPHCAVGCNINIHERDGKFRRVTNRFNPTLNGFFLCDRGRFGAGFLESPERLRSSHDRAGEPITHDTARRRLGAVLRGGRTIGIGSPRACLESNFALRALVGPENFFAGVSAQESSIMAAAAAIAAHLPLATLQDAAQADAILILGDDPATAAPRLAMSLRQAALRPDAGLLAERAIPPWHDAASRTAHNGHKTNFIIVTPFRTQLDDLASAAHRFLPEDIRQLEIGSPEIQTLRQAENPVIVAGGSAAILYAAADIAAGLRRNGINAKLSLLLPSANMLGLALMDTRPAAAALASLRAGPADLIILENDPAEIDDMAAAAASVTVLDHIETRTTRAANLAVAVGSFADSDGTFINLEGRAQRFYKAIFGANDPPAGWALLRDAGAMPWPSHAAILRALADAIPALAAAKAASPPNTSDKTPSLPYRFSGRTAAHAHPYVHEHEDSPFGTTMEGRRPASVPGWNSVQATMQLPPPPADVFLFAIEDAAPHLITPPQSSELFQPATGTEPLSNLSPAIIARRASSP